MIIELKDVQTKISKIVGNLLPEDDALLEQVYSMLEDPRWTTRLGAVLALVQSNHLTPEIIQRILASLKDVRGLESYPARLAAAKHLINQNQYNQTAIQTCLEALDYGTQSWEILRHSPEIRKQAAGVLSTLEPIRYDSRVYQKLRSAMLNDSDPSVRDAAYDALVRLARIHEISEQTGVC